MKNSHITPFTLNISYNKQYLENLYTLLLEDKNNIFYKNYEIFKFTNLIFYNILITFFYGLGFWLYQLLGVLEFKFMSLIIVCTILTYIPLNIWKYSQLKKQCIIVSIQKQKAELNAITHITCEFGDTDITVSKQKISTKYKYSLITNTIEYPEGFVLVLYDTNYSYNSDYIFIARSLINDSQIKFLQSLA